MKKSGIPTLHTLIKDLSSENYHGLRGTWSSSQLKDIEAEDADLQHFFEKHVEKSIPRESNSAFDFGTYCHSLLLEPHNLDKDCAVFTGKTRFGKSWDEFKEKHKGKAIVTLKERDLAHEAINAVKKSAVAMSFLKGTEVEVSMFVELTVSRGEIFAHHGEYKIDRKRGWIKTTPKEKARVASDKLATKVVIKVRADALGKSHIADLKTTSGNVKSSADMRGKVRSFGYRLSAALYLDMFSIGCEKTFTDFVLIFVSKETKKAKTWKMHDKAVQHGRKQWMRAVVKLADCLRDGFEEQDTLGILGLDAWEIENEDESESYDL